MKDEQGGLVNSFVGQNKVSLFTRLMDKEWLHISMSEQKRMPSGQFAAINYAIYGEVETAEGNNLSDTKCQKARDIEAWVVAKFGLKASPADSVYPAFINVNNSYCYTEPKGNCRGNTAMAPYVIILSRE